MSPATGMHWTTVAKHHSKLYCLYLTIGARTNPQASILIAR
jgi:hypothetical protein